jgi:hypothetical protein
MSSTLPAPWLRTTSRSRCPLCHRSGCLVSSPSKPDAVVCRRTGSATPVGSLGFLHELCPGPAWARWRLSLARLAKSPVTTTTRITTEGPTK